MKLSYIILIISTMDSWQERKLSVFHISEEDKTYEKQEGDDYKMINDIQTFFDKLLKNEKLILKLNTLKESMNFTKLKVLIL